MTPYWPVISNPVLRRLLPGLAVSALGDGMAIVAVSWLALQLAAPGTRGTWVAVAVAAYTLPSVLGTIVLARWLGHRDGARLAGWDATLRAASLAAIPLAYAVGALTPLLYVVLLACSSLLHSWGSAGRYTLIAELLPAKHHLAGNALIGAIAEAAAIGGPPLAGFLTATAGPVWVIAADAATFAVLAVSYRFAVPRAVRAAPPPATASRTAGFRVILRQRRLLGLLALSFGFFFLFGPVYVALPLYVADDLGGSAALLGWFFTAFGAGALGGALFTGYLRRLPLWPVTIGVVIAFGLSLMPIGLGAPVVVSLAALAAGGAIWAPYMPTAMALFQRSTTPGNRAPVLAANGAVTVVAVPAGTILGGPLVGLLGARHAMLACGVAITLFGLVAAALVTRAHPTIDIDSLASEPQPSG
ncbi:MFS family permease [Actinoplanes tereljensis]|uniref:MFS transporter n=1 Tax=Paractinoplanes tereljensis TaxID=571912 RepID=A0A919NWK3_9ACTN|nr:MFS transporter [Actinoplanes tereljensis]GIF26048.1 MFS transporter [Actinoplanes tereljensis]